MRFRHVLFLLKLSSLWFAFILKSSAWVEENHFGATHFFVRGQLICRINWRVTVIVRIAWNGIVIGTGHWRRVCVVSAVCSIKNKKQAENCEKDEKLIDRPHFELTLPPQEPDFPLTWFVGLEQFIIYFNTKILGEASRGTARHTHQSGCHKLIGQKNDSFTSLSLVWDHFFEKHEICPCFRETCNLPAKTPSNRVFSTDLVLLFSPRSLFYFPWNFWIWRSRW